MSRKTSKKIPEKTKIFFKPRKKQTKIKTNKNYNKPGKTMIFLKTK